MRSLRWQIMDCARPLARMLRVLAEYGHTPFFFPEASKNTKKTFLFFCLEPCKNLDSGPVGAPRSGLANY